MYHTYFTSTLAAGEQPYMYTHGIFFETFFFLLFSIVTLGFCAATTMAPEKKGKVIGCIVIAGFIHLTYDAWLKTCYAFTHRT